MPSPFPGMNPYLEHRNSWHDFHGAYIYAIRDALNKQIGRAYIAIVDDQLYIHEPPAKSRRLAGKSDISVTRRASRKGNGSQGVAVEAPAEVYLMDVEVERLKRIEIRDNQQRQLITVIELLSPTNKYAGPDRDQYEAKRGEILASAVHFVEIDLLRGGPRMPMTEAPRCDYCVLVSRYENRPKAEFWPIQLVDPLPSIPIPLQEGHRDAIVDLQALLNDTYDKAGYEKFIYEASPKPALCAAKAIWAKKYIPKR